MTYGCCDRHTQCLDSVGNLQMLQLSELTLCAAQPWVVIQVCNSGSFSQFPLKHARASNEMQHKAPTLCELQLLTVRLCKSKIKFHFLISRRRCRGIFLLKSVNSVKPRFSAPS